MTATEQQYLLDINSAFSDYTYNLALRENVNLNVKRNVEKIKLILLKAYVEIMDYYLRDTITGDDNFFTIAEAEDIMQKINDITEGNYWLDLS
jgi:hypothetical protein